MRELGMALSKRAYCSKLQQSSAPDAKVGTSLGKQLEQQAHMPHGWGLFREAAKKYPELQITSSSSLLWLPLQTPRQDFRMSGNLVALVGKPFGIRTILGLLRPNPNRVYRVVEAGLNYRKSQRLRALVR